MLREIELNKIVNRELVRQRGPSVRRTPTFYPSEASIVTSTGRVDGSCHRKTYYRIQGVPKTNPIKPLNMWRAKLGNKVEDIYRDQMKSAGILEANNLKFYDPSLNLSGELDMVGRHMLKNEDGTFQQDEQGNPVYAYYGVEVKSIYGSEGVARQIKGRRAWRGRPAITPYPKSSNLMQAMLYVWHFRDTLMGFKLPYIARDTGDMAEWDIRLYQYEDEGEVKHAAEVQGEPNFSFTIEGIHDRYRALKQAVVSKAKPKREFSLRYSKEEAEAQFESGEISKTKYEKWLKNSNDNVGDWQCSYCAYTDHCWKVDKDVDPIVSEA